MFKEEREGIPDWLSEWMNELSDVWIKWRIRGFFAQPLRFLRYWRTKSSNRKKSLSVRDWKSSKEHPKSIKGHLKNGPVSKYLITYKSSRLGILPSLYFLPIWWYWGIVGNLVLIYNGIVALYEALLLSKGSDGGGSVDGLQKIVIYRWTTDRLNPFQLTRTCHVYPLKKNRQHTNNWISFLFSKRRTNWLQSQMLFFLSFA